MKFVKSNWTKKIIIVLIALMIFNVAVPKEVNAGIIDEIVDAGAGLFFIPLKSLTLGVINNINITLGRFLRGVGGTVDDIIGALKNANTFGDAIKDAVSSVFIGPEDIFSGSVDILNANIFESLDGGAIGNLVSFVWEDLNPGASVGNNVRKVVANIYTLLRNICALIMLAGLLYTGIKILLTSNIPSKRMQYLMLLEDWTMGMVILIFSHIIMIIIFEVSKAFVGILEAGLMDGSSGLSLSLFWNAFTHIDFNPALTYTILYGYITWLTFVFTISYFKRFFWIVVLTIFAPVVSIMYAFGQQTKQIYSRWLKEYIMTVFLQPFHMLIYFVLIMIPLGITNSGGRVFTDNSSLFSMIYALIAMSFIRPAEKFMRELFGFDKGIAGMGSYDSGVAPIKAAAKAAIAVGSIAADVFAPGTGAAIRGVANAAESFGEGSSQEGGTVPTSEDKDDYDATDAATAAANEEIAAEGNKALGEDNEMSGLNLRSLYGKKGAINKKLKAIDNSVDWQYAAHELNGMGSPYTDEQEEERDKLLNERAEIEKQIKAGKAAQGSQPQGALESGNSNDNSGNAISGGNASGVTGSGAINVGNLTINASNIDIKGAGANSLGGKATGEGKPIAKGIAATTATAGDSLGGNEDSNFELGEGKDGKKGSAWDYVTGKAAARQLGAAHDMLTGKRSIVDAVVAPYEWIGKKTGLSGNKYISKLGNIKDFAKKFEAAGGFTEIYKGFNTVRDTMYVNGAPGDWKDTAAQMDENKKKRDEKAIYNFSHNEGNKNFMLSPQGGNLLAKYQAQYPDKSPAYQKAMAEAEAEKKLESMAKAFVPHGITDVTVAHSLKNDQKTYGYSAEEAIRQANKFARFNTSTANISVVNNAYGLKSSTPVSAKIPDAKEYFNRGIIDIGTMVNADKIAVKLSEKLGDRISDQMKKEIATAVAKKGGVAYSGSNADIRKIIDEIAKKGK